MGFAAFVVFLVGWIGLSAAIGLQCSIVLASTALGIFAAIGAFVIPLLGMILDVSGCGTGCIFWPCWFGVIVWAVASLLVAASWGVFLSVSVAIIVAVLWIASYFVVLGILTS